MAMWSKALPLTANYLSSHIWPALVFVWSMALPLTASCLSPLRACPDGCVVYGIATDSLLSLNTDYLP